MFRQVYNSNSRRSSSSSSSNGDEDNNNNNNNKSTRRSAINVKQSSSAIVAEPQEFYQGHRRVAANGGTAEKTSFPSKVNQLYRPAAEQPAAEPTVSIINNQQRAPAPAPLQTLMKKPLPRSNNKQHQEDDELFATTPGYRHPYHHQAPASLMDLPPNNNNNSLGSSSLAPPATLIKQHRGHRSHGDKTSILRTTLTAFCLFCGIVGYCFIGGLMFSYLEQSNETAECAQLRYLYQKTRNATAFTLYDIVASTDMGDEDKLEAFMPILDTLRSSIQNISWDGRNCDNMQSKWSIIGASFFSFTVVSTIGYGHIAPRTNWGRLVCIAYATVGLPLMLLTLAKVGAVFVYLFRAIYFKILCCGVCVDRRHQQARRRALQLKQLQLEQGNKTVVGGSNKPNVDNMMLMVQKEAPSSDEEEQQQQQQQQSTNNNKSNKQHSTLGPNIPLLLSLGVLASSILVGMLIYVSLEKWSITDAAYYSFISLATVGFGDLVPGYTPLTGATDEFKMCLTAGYLFWGMTVLSMSLQMMQEEVVDKFHWLGAKARQICCRKNDNNNNNNNHHGALAPGKVAPSYNNYPAAPDGGRQLAPTPRPDSASSMSPTSPTKPELSPRF